MAASRLLGAAAACGILLSFAAGRCKSRIGVAASRLRWWFVSRFSQFWRPRFCFYLFFKNSSKLCFLLWRRGPVLELQLRAFYCVLQLNLCRSHCNGCVKVAWRSSCVRKTIVFCSWTSKIVLEWLHQGCHDDLSADFLNFGTDDFFSNSFRMYY